MKTIGIKDTTHKILVSHKLKMISLTGKPDVSFDDVILNLHNYMLHHTQTTHAIQLKQVKQPKPEYNSYKQSKKHK